MQIERLKPYKLGVMTLKIVRIPDVWKVVSIVLMPMNVLVVNMGISFTTLPKIPLNVSNAPTLRK